MKMLNVDLTEKSFEVAELSEEYSKLGGRGLSSKILLDRLNPTVDPLASENLLVVTAGLLAGTKVVNCGRLSVGSKSPLTKGIKEANAGGVCARKLANLGLRAVAVTGKLQEPSVLVITPEATTIEPAKDLWGLGTYATAERIREKYGDKVGIMCCGQAGERMYKNSAVVTFSHDNYPRTAARGGLGAVMGSKNLKAIVVDDGREKRVDVADSQSLSRAAVLLANGIKNDQLMHFLKDNGTGMLVTLADGLECLATKNFSVGQFENNYEISGEKISWLANDRPNMQAQHHCMPDCLVYCSSVFTDKEGNYVTSGIEFETLALLGSNCLISDIDMLAKMDRLCDDIGIDTIEAGAAIGVAMEGALIPWGDAEAAYKLLGEIGEGTENGKLIGNGCVETGKALGVSRVPAVKGQSLSAWEPRVLKGTGVTYATSPQGADHTCGNALPSPGYNHTSPEGQAEKSLELQLYMAAIDTVGMCLFPSVAISAKSGLKKALIEAVGAVIGEELPMNYLERLGADVLSVEIEFNRRAGMTNADDRLPRFMIEETVSPSGQRFDVSDEDLDGMFDDIKKVGAFV